SQIGMVLGTIVFVNAGTQLAAIDSASGILTPALLGSFVALGLMPWAARWIMGMIKRRRVYAGFTRPKRYDRNLIVIGAGAAGLVSAYIAATVKAKVTLVESHKMGGDCLNFGCVPSKALIKSAKVAADMRHAARYGLKDAPVALDFREVLARVRAVITAIEPHDSVERFTGLGVDCVEGHATIIDPWTVRIQSRAGTVHELTTRSIVIAAGAAPFVPPIPGLGDIDFLTSDTLWDKLADREKPPERLAILGGGPIGCELAQAFARLGSNVTVIEMADQLLPREDRDVADEVRKSLESEGITVLTGHECVAARGGQLTSKSTAGETQISFDDLIVAVGRAARLSGYGLEALGIDTARTVTTDAWLTTKFPNIYAAGDVAGPYQLTHVASHQAWFATVNALFGTFKRFKADYSVIPATTFTDPEVARVGLNEREAAAQGIACEVTRYGLDDLDRAIADSAARGFVKVLTVPGKDRILGATIVGAQAGEMLGEFVLAMKKKIGLGAILGTIHAYPTMIEGNKYAAGEWRRARAPERLIGWVARYHDWRRG
ncbi:MAG: Mercuric reductase, partial [Pseudomonadota bacterium]